MTKIPLSSPGYGEESLYFYFSEKAAALFKQKNAALWGPMIMSVWFLLRIARVIFKSKEKENHLEVGSYDGRIYDV